MEFAPSCTDAEYCRYTIHVESSCLGHGWECSVIHKDEFPVCVLELHLHVSCLQAYLKKQMFFCLQMQKLLEFFFCKYKMENFSSTCYVLPPFPEIFWFFFGGGTENRFRGCLFGTSLHPRVPV